MAKDKLLTTISPEQAGIPSSAVLSFLERIATKELCLHGFLMLKHGKIVAEGYVKPFDASRLHRMYSISKTFVSAAVGLMIGEGRLTLSDNVADFFTELLPEKLHPHIAATTVRDLLIMATPFNTSTYSDYDANWVRTFFDASATHAPGTVFSYNTAGTVVLNAIVEKLAGESLIDYMRPRLLDQIDFSLEATCIERPEGGSWGGSGVLCTARDLAKFALVFLNNGRWNGQQLLPETYVKEAISKQIDTRIADDVSERQFGYGYQIWRTRNNGFAMIGMGGQYAVCLPDEDFVLVTIADTQMVQNGASEILDALWDRVYPFLSKKALLEDSFNCTKLMKACENLTFPLLDGKTDSKMISRINNCTYALEDNPMKIKCLSFDFNGDDCHMHYQNATGKHTINFSFGRYILGTFPETHYYGSKIGTPLGHGYECMSTAAWANENTLIAKVYITDDYLGTLKMQFTFGKNDISVLMAKAAEWFLNDYQGFAFGYLEA